MFVFLVFSCRLAECSEAYLISQNRKFDGLRYISSPSRIGKSLRAKDGAQARLNPIDRSALQLVVADRPFDCD